MEKKAPLIPWSAVNGISETHGDTIQAIVLSLEWDPVAVSTSPLMISMFPLCTFPPTTNSFFVLRIFIICWHYFKEDLKDHPDLTLVEERLRSDQTCICACTSSQRRLNVMLLHAYEVALVKCIHLKSGENPELTPALLEMGPATVRELGITGYLTPLDPPKEPSDESGNEIERLIQQKRAFQDSVDKLIEAKELEFSLEKLTMATADKCST